MQVLISKQSRIPLESDRRNSRTDESGTHIFIWEEPADVHVGAVPARIQACIVMANPNFLNDFPHVF